MHVLIGCLVLGTAVGTAMRLQSTGDPLLGATVLALAMVSMCVEYILPSRTRGFRQDAGTGLSIASVALVAPLGLASSTSPKGAGFGEELRRLAFYAAIATAVGLVGALVQSRNVKKMGFWPISGFCASIGIALAVSFQYMFAFDVAVVAGVQFALTAVAREYVGESFTLGEFNTIGCFATLATARSVLRLREAPGDASPPPTSLLFVEATVAAFIIALTPLCFALSTSTCKQRPLLAWLCLAVVIVGWVYPYVHLTLELEPIQWLVEYTLQGASPTGARHSVLCVWWVLVLGIGLAIAPSRPEPKVKSGDPKMSLEILGRPVRMLTARKYFHFLAVLIFTPGIAFCPEFTAVATALVLVAFLGAEVVRVFRVQPVAGIIHPYVTRYLDSRESGPLAVSHAYLLLGMGMPLWIRLGCGRASQSSYIGMGGVVTLGVGDAMASLVGCNYGRHKLPLWVDRMGKKSVEGTVVSALSMLVVLALATPQADAARAGTIVLLAGLAAVLEAATDQMDNLYLPLYFVSWALLFIR